MKTIRRKYQPHPDIELKYERSDVTAFITIPDQIDKNTGVFIVVNDLNEKGSDDFKKDELAPYLCEGLNCIVLFVNYFGYLRGERIVFTESFLNNLNRIYDLSITEEHINHFESDRDVFSFIADSIVQKHISSLDIRCQPILKTGNNEYQSWGFLPAVDNLTVLGQVMSEFEINPRRIFAYGKNYGGYVALLMGKYAPNTFSAIIERNSYVKSSLQHIVSGEVMEPDSEIRLNITGYGHDFTISCAADNPWTIEDENSPYFFSDSHRLIRNLLVEKHRIKSQTQYFSFHSTENPYSNISEKEGMVKLLSETNGIEYRRLKENEFHMDDKEFLQSFFQDHADESLNVKKTETDFQSGTHLEFITSDKVYNFNYSKNGTLAIKLLGR